MRTGNKDTPFWQLE